MERRNSKKWINDLKIAIINNDIKTIEEYSTIQIPDFSSIEEAQEALALIEQIKNDLIIKKTNISKQMQSVKQAKKYANLYTTSYTNNWKA